MKCGKLGDQSRRFPAFALVAAMIAIGIGGALQQASAADRDVRYIRVTGTESTTRFVPLGIGKSLVIDLPRDAKDVLVANPKIANAVVRSARRAYLIGVGIGQTNVFFFDETGQQIAGFDIAVTRDLNGVRAALKQLLPNAEIRIEGVNDGVMLAGTVANAAESQQAFDLATRLVGDNTKVLNALTVRGRDQVMLKVTVAEVQRDVIKQLGINLSGTLGYGTTVLNFNSTNPFSNAGSLLNNTAATGTFKSVSATLQAMDRAGVIRTLAEPNLTAISGETANFLAGGEFPVPGGFVCDTTTRNCQTQIQWKKFGVGLSFTPIVLSEGRISLRVLTEVSDLSADNSLTLTQQLSAVQGDVATQTIPSIRTRRAETTVEIPSGGALAMAGMIQDQTKQAINGVPGLMQLPVLGALFRSRDYQNRQTELMVIVTPYVVHPVSPNKLARPDDAFADASDPATVLLGSLNRIYGVPRQTAVKTPQTYKGPYGFILD